MRYTMFIGGYGADGISRVVLRGGRFTHLASFPAERPSWLTLSPDGRHLYAVGETVSFRGAAGGSVSSFDISSTGALVRTSCRGTMGADPCHLSIVDSCLLVANYTSGSLSRFPLEEDGKLAPMLPLIVGDGHGPVAGRQEGPHFHQTSLTSFGYVAVCDLGADLIRFIPTPEITSPSPSQVVVRTPAGFGPRHAYFPQGSDVWYVLCELRSELLVYRGAPGHEALIGRVPVGSGTAPDQPAALRCSEDGSMLIATGRGQNVVDLFRLSPSGLPIRMAEVRSGGSWPRDARFTPDGAYAVCANERGNALTAFRVENGHLISTDTLALEAPTCIVFTENTREEE